MNGGRTNVMVKMEQCQVWQEQQDAWCQDLPAEGLDVVVALVLVPTVLLDFAMRPCWGLSGVT
jgi:hypothetical protein